MDKDKRSLLRKILDLILAVIAAVIGWLKKDDDDDVAPSR